VSVCCQCRIFSVANKQLRVIWCKLVRTNGRLYELAWKLVTAQIYK